MNKGWQTKMLGEVCIVDKHQGIHSKLPYVGLEDIEANTGRFIGSTEPLAVKSSTFKFSPAHVLYGRLRPYLNKVILPNFTGHCSTEIFPLRPCDGLSRQFLQYWLLWDATVEKINATSTGARMPRANMNAVFNFMFPLPPVAEQLRLVGVLEKAWEGIATATTNVLQSLGDARELFESYLHSVFALRGSKWDRVTLATLLERGWIQGHLDGNHGSDYPRKEEFTRSGVPYISANCLEDERVNMSRAKFLSPSRASLIRKGVAKDGDVLFAHNATVGPVAILHTDEPKVILGTSLTYYRCNPKHIRPDYLAHYMRSFEFKTQYLQVMRQSTRNQVPITKQREFWHVVPPLDEQERMVVALNGLLENGQRLASIYERKHAALQAFKKSLLHQAFSGAM